MTGGRPMSQAQNEDSEFEWGDLPAAIRGDRQFVHEMAGLVRVLMASGKTEDQIIQALVDRDLSLNEARYVLAMVIRSREPAAQGSPSVFSGNIYMKQMTAEEHAIQKKEDRRERRKRSEEHTSELQSLRHLVCRLL